MVKTLGAMVTVCDEDILDRVVWQAAQQVDHLVVSVGLAWWEGYPGPKPPRDTPQALTQWCQEVGLDNVLVMSSQAQTQVEQRNEIIDAAIDMGLLEEGDIHLTIDADEVWHHQDIQAHLEYMAQWTAVETMAVPMLDLYFDGDHVRASVTGSMPAFSVKTRLHRYHKGAGFVGNNDWCYGRSPGDPYPNLRWDSNAPRSWDLLEAILPCWHYDYARPAERCRHKAQAHRHRSRGAIRANWYQEVWEPCRRDPMGLNGTPQGIGLVNQLGYKAISLPVGPIPAAALGHPQVMQGYPPLDPWSPGDEARAGGARGQWGQFLEQVRNP